MTTDRSVYDPACDPYVGLLVRAAEAALPADDQRRLDSHLATCAGCREALADQRLAHSVLVAWRPPLASPSFASVVLGAIDAESQVPWLEAWDFRRWTWRLAPLAAGLVVAAAVVAGRADGASAATLDPAVAERALSLTFDADQLTMAEALALLATPDADASVAATIEEAVQ